MRINSNIRNEPSENFSAFYSAFAEQFSSILDSRPIHDTTFQNYVPVEKSEKAVKRFLNQSKKGIALFRGGQGSGKSSTLYFIHRQYRDKITTRSILIDLRQHGSKIPESLGNIAALDDRVAACIPKVRELISSRFQSTSNSLIRQLRLDDSSITARVFNYCLRYHLHVIPVNLRETPYNDPKIFTPEFVQGIKNALMSNYSFHDAFYFMKYIYLLSEYKKVRKIAVIIDNGDQLPYEMIEAAVFCANYYSSCLNASQPRRRSNKEIVIGRVRINFIIACRHYNYEKMVIRSNVNSLGSHSHIPITHSGLPSLNKIVQRRLRHAKRFGTYSFRKGIRLSDVNSRRCIKAYFKQLDDSGCYSQIMKIHNHNLADAFDCIKSITQNRFFPRFDAFVEQFHFRSEKEREFTIPVNALIMLRCVLWGNPENRLQTIYPTSPCDIPNLFFWNGVDLFSFLLPLRILLLLNRLSASVESNSMTGVKQIFTTLNRTFDLDEELYSRTIADMAKNKLIFSYAAQELLSVNTYDAIAYSWRAAYIIDNIRRYNPICHAYLEDLEVIEGNEHDILADQGKPLRFQNDAAVLSLLCYCYDIELAQMEILKANKKLDNYKSLFPRTPLCDMLYSSLRRELKEVPQELAIKFSDIRQSIVTMLEGGGGLEGLKQYELKKCVLPSSLENGVRVVVDNISDEDRRQNYLNLIREIKDQLSSSDADNNTLKKISKKFSDFVKLGRDGEKVGEWSQELLELFELMGNNPPPV